MSTLLTHRDAHYTHLGCIYDTWGALPTPLPHNLSLVSQPLRSTLLLLRNRGGKCLTRCETTIIPPPWKGQPTYCRSLAPTDFLNLDLAPPHLKEFQNTALHPNMCPPTTHTFSTFILLLTCWTFRRLVAILGQAFYKTPKSSIWFPFDILLKLIIHVAMLWWYTTNKQKTRNVHNFHCWQDMAPMHAHLIQCNGWRSDSLVLERKTPDKHNACTEGREVLAATHKPASCSQLHEYFVFRYDYPFYIHT